MEDYRAALREPDQRARIALPAVENPLSLRADRMNTQDITTTVLLALRSEVRVQNQIMFNNLRNTKRLLYCVLIVQAVVLVIILGVFVKAEPGTAVREANNLEAIPLCHSRGQANDVQIVHSQIRAVRTSGAALRRSGCS